MKYSTVRTKTENGVVKLIKKSVDYKTIVNMCNVLQANRLGFDLSKGKEETVLHIPDFYVSCSGDYKLNGRTVSKKTALLFK